MMVPPTIAAALAEVTAEARDAGYREGYEQGRRDEREQWRHRLRGLLGDAEVAACANPAPAAEACNTAGADDGPDAGNPGGGDVNRQDHDNRQTGAECKPAAPVEPAGLMEAANRADQADDEDGQDGGRQRWPQASDGEPGPVPVPAPPGPPPEERPAASPPAAAAAASAVGWQDWRTAPREVEFRRVWPQLHLSWRDMWNAVAAVPGPKMPTAVESLAHWARKLDLPTRRAKPGVKAVVPRPAPAPPAPAPQDGSRESPQMVRARELLAMGFHPNDIKAAVKLTVVEFAEVQRAHAVAGVSAGAAA